MDGLRALPAVVQRLDLTFQPRPDLLDFAVGEMLDSDELVSRVAQRADDFVEFRLKRRSVPVLGVLDVRRKHTSFSRPIISLAAAK